MPAVLSGHQVTLLTGRVLRDSLGGSGLSFFFYSSKLAQPSRLKGRSQRIVYNLPSIASSKRTPLALDDHIYNLRREKLKQIEALGQATYRSKYEFTHTLEQILAEYTAKTAEELEQARVNVRVAGRIMAIRLMGKAGFAHLQQNGKRLQIYVKKDAV